MKPKVTKLEIAILILGLVVVLAIALKAGMPPRGGVSDREIAWTLQSANVPDSLIAQYLGMPRDVTVGSGGVIQPESYLHVTSDGMTVIEFMPMIVSDSQVWFVGRVLANLRAQGK